MALPPFAWIMPQGEHAGEQVEAGATVHLPLDQLEPGDLASAWPLLQGVVRAAWIAAPSCSSPAANLHSTDPRRPGVSKPRVQCHARRLRADLRVDPTPAHEGRQPAGQPGNVRSRRVLLDLRHEGCIRPRQRRRGLDEQPSELRG